MKNISFVIGVFLLFFTVTGNLLASTVAPDGDNPDSLRLAALAGLHNEQFLTNCGQVYFKDCEVTIYDFDFALKRLHDIHLRCTGGKPILQIQDNITVEDAKSLFRVSATALLCQIAMAPEELKRTYLDTIVDTASKLRSTEGLESFFYTALFCNETEKEDVLEKKCLILIKLMDRLKKRTLVED